MGQIELTAGIQLVHELQIAVVIRAQPEADKAEWVGRGDLETVVGGDPTGEFLRQRDVRTNMVPQPGNPIAADDRPELEGAESPAQLDMPVPIVHDVAGRGGGVA